MRIGHYTIIRTAKYNDTILFSAVRQEVQQYLNDPGGRRLVAKVARSEAKDFIAENYENPPNPTLLAQLECDHHDLLFLLADSLLVKPRIHADSRCEKMRVPHVLTVDCWPQPDDPDHPVTEYPVVAEGNAR